MDLREIAERHGLIFGNCPEFPESSEQIFAALREAIAVEREDALVTRAHNTAASNCAAAIRARSNK